MEKTNKQKLKLLRFWLKHKLRPYVRIEPKIEHLDNKFFEVKEILKQFQDENIQCVNNGLGLKDIMKADLSNAEKLDFLKLHCPAIVKQISKLI